MSTQLGTVQVTTELEPNDEQAALLRQNMPGVARALDKLEQAVSENTDGMLDQIINHSTSELFTPKIVDYKVCLGDTAEMLRMVLLTQVAEGYVPIGGVSVAYQCFQVAKEGLPQDIYVFSQAVVLYEV